MGFKEKLRLRDLLSFLTAPSRKSLIYVIDDDDNSTVPATKSMFGGGSGGGGSTALVPLGNHITLPLDGTAQDVDWPDGTLGAEIGITGGSARVAVSNPPPTATTGRLWSDGDVWELSQGDIPGFRAIAAEGSPVLDIQPLGAP